LSVDGHIVRVVTDAGIFDLRMRFTDAIEEVLELDGVCTHRSHWVVLTEIANVGTVNGRSCLLLSNGDEVPVSRKYQPELEMRGIL
jgi:DNA-binding LytR/AlgR family response regulator